MFAIGPIGFAAPLVLLGLIVLPILWLLLRAVPPAPVRRRFPGIALLLGLTDDDHETDKMPWWLLALRCLAVAAAIIGFAGPVLNPQERAEGAGPVLILFDGSWASAPVWEAQNDRVRQALDRAARNGRAVAMLSLSDPAPGPLAFQGAEVWAQRLPSYEPKSWAPDPGVVDEFITRLAVEARFDTLWISDGLARGSRAALLAALAAKGAVQVIESPRPVLGLRPARFEGGVVRVLVLRNRAGAGGEVEVIARGRDPVGIERDLARATAEFAASDRQAEIALSLPAELRNRITRFEVAGARSAGAVILADDALKRREVALIAGREDREGLELLSPLHYLRQALAPTADLIGGALDDILLANPDVIVLADVAKLAEAEVAGLTSWIEQGGFLLRFSGPRLAASDVSRDTLDPLMPVRLRAGGRAVGGAMSWGEPKSLRAFSPSSPFFGLSVPGDVTVSAQVMAQPDPELADRVIASLTDGTPLITRRAIGEGQVILFHVTANAEWSTLPLSGLFVAMLERLAISTRPTWPDAEAMAGTTWVPEKLLDGFGIARDAGARAGVLGEVLAEGAIGPDLPPGLYAGAERQLALNVLDPTSALAAATWPAGIPVEGLTTFAETPLKGLLLALAGALLLIDIVASLWISGRLAGPRGAMAGLALALAVNPGSAPVAQAQEVDDALALRVTSEVVLAHVITGDASVDGVARAGLTGLSDRLYRRTSIEPAAPVAVDLETDELSFFPFLYWPVTPDQPVPSAEAYARLNRYLRTGGMIMFDTRDAHLTRRGSTTPETRHLRNLARSLDLPPLEPIPPDHVLTRTFYLLQDFPGRHASREVWVEAAPADAIRAEGMPFRNLNDGVTPVVIGGNDWAAAWAINERGQSLFPVGRGFTGERQREIAYRFGINLIMHVLTGNYKSDQVHVPALLDRLGQ